MTQRLYRPLVFFLIPVLLIWGLVGCTDLSGGSSPSALPQCDSTDNIFYQPIPYLPQAIGTLTVMNPIEGDSTSRKATALSVLIHEVKKWSVQHDIQQGQATYRFTITLMTPELMSAIVVADYAYNSWPYSDVEVRLKAWNDEMMAKNRIMFLMSVNSSNQDQVNKPDQDDIYTPIKDITLRTMSGLATSQPQGEGVFNYNLDTYDAPIQYYFYFPSTVSDGNACKPLFDPKQDLSFTLGIETVQIGGKQIGNLVWNFELMHLINIGEESGMLKFLPDEIVTQLDVANWPTYCSLPPAAVKDNTAAGSHLGGDHTYWIEFSNCIWQHILGSP